MTRDWDARTYHRVSADVQVKWAVDVLDRLDLRGDETVLDAGCGSGRVTAMLLERLPHGHVVAVDGSQQMVEQARDALPAERATVFQSDLLELKLDTPVDAVFSNAVFHWITDHERLYERLAAALRPGGQLVVQYGGEGNIARFLEVATAVGDSEPYASYAKPVGKWRFTDPDYARRTAEGVGFTDIEAWLEPRAMRPAEPVEFMRSVCLREHLPRLPEGLRDRFVQDVADALGEPFEIDYVRLNVTARKEPS